MVIVMLITLSSVNTKIRKTIRLSTWFACQTYVRMRDMGEMEMQL